MIGLGSIIEMHAKSVMLKATIMRKGRWSSVKDVPVPTTKIAWALEQHGTIWLLK